MRVAICELITLLFFFFHTAGTVKIAIVGGGIGGASSAYFLKKLVPPEKLTQIDLFTNADIGGRIATISVPYNGKERLFEAGGSVLYAHPNAYFAQFMDSFGMRKKDRPSQRGRMGVWNGKETVFSHSDWYLLTLYRMVRRYNLDLVRNYFEIKNLLSDLGFLYDLLNQGHSFANIDAVMDVGLPTLADLMNITLFEHLQKSGYHKAFIDDIATGSMNLDYVQSIKNAHALVGSFVRIGSATPIYSVHGPIGDVMKSMVEYSGAKVIKSNVEMVSRNGSSFGIIGNNGQVLGDQYDYVILAVPFHQEQNIKIEGVDISDQFMEYLRVVTTFVEGSLRESTFGLSKCESLRTVLVANNDFTFTSLLQVTPTDYTKDEPTKLPVWMLFAKGSIPSAELKLLFDEINTVREAPFLAYPNYGKQLRGRPRFLLADGICHTNAIEWIASTIEMGAVGARNCVNLLMHDLGILPEKSKVKGEL